MLKWILNLAALFLLIRFFRGLLRRRPPVGPADPPRRGLDPERAVRASWSEVPDEAREEGPR